MPHTTTQPITSQPPDVGGARQTPRTIRPSGIALSVVAVAVSYIAVRHGFSGQADIIRKAAGIPENAGGLERFVATCDALITPCLVAAAAATPLAAIGGGVAMAFGSRRGLPLVVTALGILALLGSVKGIVQ